MLGGLLCVHVADRDLHVPVGVLGARGLALQAQELVGLRHGAEDVGRVHADLGSRNRS